MSVSLRKPVNLAKRQPRVQVDRAVKDALVIRNGRLAVVEVNFIDRTMPLIAQRGSYRAAR